MTASGTCSWSLIGNTTSSRDCVSSVIWPSCSSRPRPVLTMQAASKGGASLGTPPGVCHAKRSITWGLTNKWPFSNRLVSARNWGFLSSMRCWQALSMGGPISRYANSSVLHFMALRHRRIDVT